MNIIQQMPAAEYHAHPAVSKSLLDKIALSPMHARAYLDGVRQEPTAVMEFGTALHTAALEPDRFAEEYRIFDGDRRTKAGKEAYEAMRASGKTIISAADFDAVTAMVANIRQHPTASTLLLDGIAEASVFWTDRLAGVDCKCRPDWLRNDGICVDLKTTDNASPTAFARSVVNYRYHVQAAHYMTGTDAERFVFIALEKKPPYAVAVYELDVAALLEGERLRVRDLERYASCAEFNVWPGYSPQIQTLELPAWATNGEEE